MLGHTVQSFEGPLNFNKLRCFEHVSPMFLEQLYRCSKIQGMVVMGQVGEKVWKL